MKSFGECGVCKKEVLPIKFCCGHQICIDCLHSLRFCVSEIHCLECNKPAKITHISVFKVS